MSLVRLHSPETDPELLAVVALFEAHDIPCFVHNAGFGGLLPGVQVNAYNNRSIMVPEEKLPQALELLRDFQAQPADAGSAAGPSGTDFTLRTALELLFFGWFVPGRRKRK